MTSMNKDEVKKLATLARIEMTEEELSKMSTEIDAVLEYVGQIKGAVSGKKSAKTNGAKSDQDEARIESASVRNVMRNDDSSHAGDINREKLLAEAPDRDGDYIKVKKIL